MGILNTVVWATALTWVWAEVAAYSGLETWNAIVDWMLESVKSWTNMILESWIDLSSITSYISENSPLSVSWWEELVWPGMFWVAWMAISNYASKKLWKWTWTDNKVDDNIAWASWLVWWIWFWLGSASLAGAWLTWLSYVWSRKVIEKMIPSNYSHLAKYLALIPAWAVASSTWLVDWLSVLAPILAWTAIFWVNKMRS